MTKDLKSNSTKPDNKPGNNGYLINEKGEEIPITEEMMAESMRKIKLKSIGAHTGYTKAVTDDMVPEVTET